MAFTHVLITRPRPEALELADLLAQVPAEIVLLPSHTFQPVKLQPEQLAQLQAAAAMSRPALLIFTSPRAVEFGLGQLPPAVVRRAKVAAIGPSTAACLERAEIEVGIRSRQGYDSEHLLRELASLPPAQAGETPAAFVLAAPGGRTLVRDSLETIGYSVHTLVVYESTPAELDRAAVAAIEQAGRTLTLFTSGNAMNSLSTRLPGRCWRRLCAGDWMVVSERLAQLARAYKPGGIHITRGPANEDIASAISTLFQ